MVSFPSHVFFLAFTFRHPPTPTPFPYTPLFRSRRGQARRPEAQRLDHGSGLRPPQPGATSNDRMRHGQRQGSAGQRQAVRSEEHTSELQSLRHLVCRLLLEKKKTKKKQRRKQQQ